MSAKKLFSKPTILLAVLALGFASCSNGTNAKAIKEYEKVVVKIEKAAKNDDGLEYLKWALKAAQITEKIDKKTLTKKQQKKIDMLEKRHSIASEKIMGS